MKHFTPSNVSSWGFRRSQWTEAIRKFSLPRAIYRSDAGSSTYLWNVGLLQPDYKALCLRKLSSSDSFVTSYCSTLREPRNSLPFVEPEVPCRVYQTLSGVKMMFLKNVNVYVLIHTTLLPRRPTSTNVALALVCHFYIFKFHSRNQQALGTNVRELGTWLNFCAEAKAREPRPIHYGYSTPWQYFVLKHLWTLLNHAADYLTTLLSTPVL
jgi:hypothetical protein